MRWATRCSRVDGAGRGRRGARAPRRRPAAPAALHEAGRGRHGPARRPGGRDRARTERAASRAGRAGGRDPARIRRAGPGAERSRRPRRPHGAERARHDRRRLPRRGAGAARQPGARAGARPARRPHRAAGDRARRPRHLARGRHAPGERARRGRLRQHRHPGGARARLCRAGRRGPGRAAGAAREFIRSARSARAPDGAPEVLARYTRPEMGRLWSEETRLARWLEVELALVDVLAERGEVPVEAARTLRAKVRVNVARMQAIEAEVKHDVIAFVSSLAEQVGDEGRFLHLGLTSSDVVDTAFALQLRDAADLLLVGLDRLRAAVRGQALRHRRTPMIGRTHGIHAEVITFGLKCASWYAELTRGRRGLSVARAAIAHGKLSGAVGTFANIEPAVEAAVLRRLGLRPESIATQVVPRDRHARFFAELALLAGSCERIAVEIRHLQRTEVGEVLEPFAPGQKGSSAMPHKRNPILSENVTGLARLVRGYAATALENMALWHERDISHSSVERVIGPDAAIVMDFMLARLADVIEGLEVRPEVMRANLERLGGAIFSEQVLLALVRRGVKRDEAYRWVQRCALAGGDFQQRLAADPDVSRHLKPLDLATLFDMEHHLRHIQALFSRALEDDDGSR